MFPAEMPIDLGMMLMSDAGHFEWLPLLILQLNVTLIHQWQGKYCTLKLR